MDVLLVEPVHPEVLHWLQARRSVHQDTRLAREPAALRAALAEARAAIVPAQVTLDAAVLRAAPRLRVIGRLSGGPEHIDLEACALAGVEVVRPASASAQAEAEFVIGALVQMLRRVPVPGADGALVGRELHGATVGLVGLTPAARPLAALLRAFGARVVGYDPGLHATDPGWDRAGVPPVALSELLHGCDAVAVLLLHYRRYAGLFGARRLGECRDQQVWVSLAPAEVFEEHALAQALAEGPLAAAWLDSVDPAWLEPGRPLRHRDNLQVTPRVAATTEGARLRGAWALARRIDEVLAQPHWNGAAPERRLGFFRPSQPGDLADLEAG
jgi:phosphoglycerate dehydrogenase-like enzyme